MSRIYLFSYLFILALISADLSSGQWIYNQISADGTVTFDDIGLQNVTKEDGGIGVGYGPLNPIVVFNNSDLVVYLDGRLTCEMFFLIRDGPENSWYSADNWAGSSTEQPGYYAEGTNCTLLFSRPINAFSMHVGYNIMDTINVYDASNNLLISTTFTPTVNASVINDFNYFGYASTELISSFNVQSDFFQFDNIQFITCNASQQFNGSSCVDLCILNPCIHGSCSSSSGSRVCTCNNGYELQGSDCVDVDECKDSPCSSFASCNNTDGSFSCNCNAGYEGDGLTCTDINECDTSPCGPGGQCNNTAGSYECHCFNGYENKGLTCSDIDECSLPTSPCSPNAHCNNTEGSFKCTCNAGYEGDGLTCTDINECSLLQSPCDLNAFCNNTDGSFKCTCKEGYTGEGYGTNGCVEIEAPQTQAEPVNSNRPEGSKTVSSSTSLTSEKVVFIALVALTWL